MRSKPFQCKPTIIICNDCGVEVKQSSMSIAETTLSLARMANNPRYHAPADGYDQDVLKIQDCIKDSTRQTVRHYDRNIILLIKKKQTVLA